MKEGNFIEFIIKNKIVIICLAVALILIASGLLKVIFNVGLALLVLVGAVYLGYKIQEDKDYFKNFFRPKDKE